MNLQTRTAWAMTGVVIVVMLLVLARTFDWLDAYGAVGDWSLQGLVFNAVFFGAPLVLGIAIAWWRLLHDRKARRNRPRPLDLD